MGRALLPAMCSDDQDFADRSVRATHAGRNARATHLLLLLGFIVLPAFAHAYAGPGAGFAVLSSFWAIFVAFLYSFYALATWPFRHLFRFIRRRNAYGKAKFKRAVILGFDGMDPELADRFMNEGRLPNLSKLRAHGTFSKLRTTFPPISPVAWSTFMTGVNPGKHNIYDFLARDKEQLSAVSFFRRNQGAEAALEDREILDPVWQAANQGHAQGHAFLALAGKGGDFQFGDSRAGDVSSGKVSGCVAFGDVRAGFEGQPGNILFLHDARVERQVSRRRRPRAGGAREWRLPFVCSGAGESAGGKTGSELRVAFEARPDGREAARIEVGAENFTLKVGEYSEWIPVKFKAGLGFNAHGICRFYLKEVSPEVEVYVTPVNIDPAQPDLPISHPVTYSIYLSKLFGPYATLGLAEDTWALNEHVLDDDAFLAQAYRTTTTANACCSMHWRRRSRDCAPASSIRRIACSTCSGGIWRKGIRRRARCRGSSVAM